MKDNEKVIDKLVDNYKKRPIDSKWSHVKLNNDEMVNHYH